MDGRRFVLRHLLCRNELYNASMAVFRRSALPAAGEYEGFRYAGDWYFWMLVALQGRVSTVFEPLNAFRRRRFGRNEAYERLWSRWCETYRCDPLRRAWYRIYGALPDSMFF